MSRNISICLIFIFQLFSPLLSTTDPQQAGTSTTEENPLETRPSTSEVNPHEAGPSQGSTPLEIVPWSSKFLPEELGRHQTDEDFRIQNEEEWYKWMSYFPVAIHYTVLGNILSLPLEVIEFLSKFYTYCKQVQFTSEYFESMQMSIAQVILLVKEKQNLIQFNVYLTLIMNDLSNQVLKMRQQVNPGRAINYKTILELLTESRFFISNMMEYRSSDLNGMLQIEKVMPVIQTLPRLIRLKIGIMCIGLFKIEDQKIKVLYEHQIIQGMKLYLWQKENNYPSPVQFYLADLSRTDEKIKLYFENELRATALINAEKFISLGFDSSWILNDIKQNFYKNTPGVAVITEPRPSSSTQAPGPSAKSKEVVTAESFRMPEDPSLEKWLKEKEKDMQLSLTPQHQQGQEVPSKEAEPPITEEQETIRTDSTESIYKLPQLLETEGPLENAINSKIDELEKCIAECTNENLKSMLVVKYTYLRISYNQNKDKEQLTTNTFSLLKKCTDGVSESSKRKEIVIEEEQQTKKGKMPESSFIPLTVEEERIPTEQFHETHPQINVEQFEMSQQIPEVSEFRFVGDTDQGNQEINLEEDKEEDAINRENWLKLGL